MTLRHFFFHNFGLKFVSIALGTIIWLAIHHSIDNNYELAEPVGGQRLIKQTIQVPISGIRQEGDPRNFVFDPTNATVTVVGESAALHDEGRNIKVMVDLADFHSAGPVQLDLRASVPQDLTVTDYKPRTVSVSIETNGH